MTKNGCCTSLVADAHTVNLLCVWLSPNDVLVILDRARLWILRGNKTPDLNLTFFKETLLVNQNAARSEKKSLKHVLENEERRQSRKENILFTVQAVTKSKSKPTMWQYILVTLRHLSAWSNFHDSKGKKKNVTFEGAHSDPVTHSMNSERQWAKTTRLSLAVSPGALKCEIDARLSFFLQITQGFSFTSCFFPVWRHLFNHRATETGVGHLHHFQVLHFFFNC